MLLGKGVHPLIVLILLFLLFSGGSLSVLLDHGGSRRLDNRWYLLGRGRPGSFLFWSRCCLRLWCSCWFGLLRCSGDCITGDDLRLDKEHLDLLPVNLGLLCLTDAIVVLRSLGVHGNELGDRSLIDLPLFNLEL